jgi:hypothetical protein
MKIDLTAGLNRACLLVAGVLMAGTVPGLPLATSPAQAGVVCLTYNGTTETPSTGTQGSCIASAETAVKLNNASNVMSGSGLAGTTTVDFSSTTAIDFASGAATITPNAKGTNASYANLTITTPGTDFTDLLFGLQMANLDATSLTVEALYKGTIEGEWVLTGLDHSANRPVSIIGSSGTVFDEVILTAGSASGIKETKQFELSGIGTPVPETSTWVMMILGFAGLGYAGYRKKGGARMASIA